MRDSLLSDIVSIVEDLLVCCPVGYVASADHPLAEKWTLRGYLACGAETESTPGTVFSSVELTSVSDSLYGRLRSESLKCLNLVLRSNSARYGEPLCNLVLDRANMPGLATIARIDDNPYARRYAFYSLVALLRSPKTPKSSRFFTAEDVQSFSFIQKSLTSLLQSTDPQDRVTVSHVLLNVISLTPWKAIEKTGELHNTLFRGLLENLKQTGIDSTTVILISGMAAISAATAVDSGLRCDAIDWIQIYCPQLAEAMEYRSGIILQINCLIYSLKIDDRSDEIQIYIHEGLEILTRKSSVEPVDRATISMCLFNVSRLTTVNARVLHNLISLATSELPESHKDALFGGLGKLSRLSASSLQAILTIDLVSLIPDILSPISLQAVGDLVFSAIIFGIENEKVYPLIARLTEWGSLNRGFCLRAIMTGLSRIRDTGDRQTVTDQRLLQIQISTQQFLIGLWSDGLHSCEERLASDSVRSIGLVEAVFACNHDFQRAAEHALAAALFSRKTQRILASIASLCATEMHKSDNMRMLVLEMLKDVITTLRSRRSWDFESSDSVAGALHVINDGIAFLISQGCPQSLNLDRDQIVSIGSSIRKYRIYRYNPSILVYLESIERLID